VTTDLRPTFARWPIYQQRLRDRVAEMTDEQLALRPSSERWPLWATIGHLCCQRVSWLCGFAGEPGAETTPFPDALHRCPGDEYLDPPLSKDELLEALDSTYRIVDNCLGRWTPADMAEEIYRDFGEWKPRHTRGWVISGSLAHDVYHCAEVNEVLTANGLPLIDLWS
jgi:hypothetical protein